MVHVCVNVGGLFGVRFVPVSIMISSLLIPVTLAMKFYEVQQKGSNMSSVKERWKEMLVEFGRYIYFDRLTCVEVRNGLRVGHLLELPFQMTCKYQHLSDLLLPELSTKTRSFVELK